MIAHTCNPSTTECPVSINQELKMSLRALAYHVQDPRFDLQHCKNPFLMFENLGFDFSD
jgi:hypothetical protein